MRFNERLSREMLKANITELGLADRCKVSHVTVKNWLAGEYLPGTTALIELSKVFNVSIDDLLGLTTVRP